MRAISASSAAVACARVSATLTAETGHACGSPMGGAAVLQQGCSSTDVDGRPKGTVRVQLPIGDSINYVVSGMQAIRDRSSVKQSWPPSVSFDVQQCAKARIARPKRIGSACAGGGMWPKATTVLRLAVVLAIRACIPNMQLSRPLPDGSTQDCNW
jgi:hypothetical protein